MVLMELKCHHIQCENHKPTLISSRLSAQWAWVVLSILIFCLWCLWYQSVNSKYHHIHHIQFHDTGWLRLGFPYWIIIIPNILGSIIPYNVVKTIISHPAVITIFIGDKNHSQSRVVYGIVLTTWLTDAFHVGNGWVAGGCWDSY